MKNAPALPCRFGVRVVFPRILGACVFIGLLTPAITFAHEGHDHNADAERQQALQRMGLDEQGNPLPTAPQPAQNPALPQQPAVPAMLPNQPATMPPKASSALPKPIVAPATVPTANPIAPSPAVQPTPTEAITQSPLKP